MCNAEWWEDSGVDADVEFHRNVAQATGNAYITMVISFLSEQVRLSIMEARSRHPSMQEIIDITIAEHVAIDDAIASGSPTATRDAMWQHIRNAAQRIGAGVPDLGEY
jgi:DNA-binding FadR family transcriptional regulator